MRPIQMISAVLLLVSAQSALRAEESAGAWSIDRIPWKSAAANGTKYALLEGDRDKDGQSFTYAFFIPAGVWDTPHWHSTTARVFVAKGALGIGYGKHLDKSEAKIYHTGDFLLVPGKSVHFDGADEDTIIIGVASGPWETAYLDASKPASAGTPVH